jgi:uncharacterized membrane protein YdjX (TVP38/TMEM64 family)
MSVLERREAENRRRRLVSLGMRMLPLVLLIVVGAVAVILAGGPRQAFHQVATQRAWLEALVADHGVLAPVVYVVCYAALMTLMWIPASMVTMIGGFLFGFWLGALCAVAGATLGGTTVFLLARWGLVGLMERAGPHVHRLEAGFRKDAFAYILGLRLLPMVPFAVVNMVAAALGVRLAVFVPGTALGIIPGALIYAGLGSGIQEAAIDGAAFDGDLLARPGLLLPLVGLAVLAIAPVLWRRWRRS